MIYRKKESFVKWIMLFCAILFGMLFMLLFIFFAIEPIIGIPIDEPHKPSLFELFILLPLVLVIFIIGMIIGTFIGLMLIKLFVNKYEIDEMIKQPYIKGVSDLCSRMINVVYRDNEKKGN